MKYVTDIYGDEPLDQIKAMRHHRDGLLSASDWTQLPDNGLSDDQRAAWAVYRQALRDAPANWEPAPTWDAPDPPT